MGGFEDPDDDDFWDSVVDKTHIINLRTGVVSDGPDIPGESFDGCVAIAEDLIYLVRGRKLDFDGETYVDTAEVYRARVEDIVGVGGADSDGGLLALAPSVAPTL